MTHPCIACGAPVTKPRRVVCSIACRNQLNGQRAKRKGRMVVVGIHVPPGDWAAIKGIARTHLTTANEVVRQLIRAKIEEGKE